MAGENEIVIPISADITKLIEQINKLTGDVEELKGLFGEAGAEMKKSFTGAESSLESTTKAYSDLEKEIRDVTNAMKGQTDPKVIAAQKQYVQELQKEQGELQKTGKAFVTLRSQIKAVKDEMAFMIEQGQQGTQRFRDLQQQLGKLSDRRKDIQELGNVIGSDTRKFDTFAQAVGGVAAAFSVYQGVLALVGSENKDFQKTMTKVMGAMAVANGVQQIANMLQKESAVMVALNNLKVKLLTKSTEGATVAQRAFNIAMKANPIGIVLTAVTAVVAAYLLYRKELKEVSDEQKNQNLILQKSAESYAENVAEIELYTSVLKDSTSTDFDKTEAIKALDKAMGTNIASQKDLNKQVEIAIALSPLYIKRLKAEADAQAAMSLYVDFRKEQFKLEQSTLEENISTWDELVGLVNTGYNVNLAGAQKWTKAINENAKKSDEFFNIFIKENKEANKAQADFNKMAKDYGVLLDKNKKSAEDLRNEEVRLYTDMKMGVISTSKEVSELIKRYRELFLEFDAAKRNKTDMPFGEDLPKTLDKVSVSIADVAKKYGIALKYISENTEELNEEQKTFWDEYGEDITKWTNVATQAIGVLFSAMSVSSDNALTEIDKNFTSQEARYKDMLDRQVISQEEYDSKISALEKKKAAEEKKIKHDAWERERTANLINTTIQGTLGALAQLGTGAAGWVLFGLAEALTLASAAVIAGQKNPYRKGTAQILGGRSHEAGGVSLGQFGEAEKGEFLGILSKRQTSTYGNGLMNLFEGLNKNNKDKVLTGLTDIASNVGFSDTNTNLSVSLNEVREIKSIEKMMKSGNTSVTYHNGYREEKSKGLIRRVYV